MNDPRRYIRACLRPETDRSTATCDSPRVLVAEQDPLTRLRLARLLNEAGFGATCVADGASALDTLDLDFHPLLLCDWDVPACGFRSLIDAVRARAWPGYLYAVTFTGLAPTEHVLEALRAGADDYLVKPVNEAELLARLSTGVRVLEFERRLVAAEREARRLAIVDALTGVYNRRRLFESLPLELEAARRFGHPVAVVMADLDRFKFVNDTWGHAAGDRALCAFARALRRTLRRDVDWIARYGGEEFVLVLPGTSLQGAATMAERCRERTQRLDLRECGVRVPLTASFGVAVASFDVPSHKAGEAVIARADACLYASKAAGRNRVTMDAAEPG